MEPIWDRLPKIWVLLHAGIQELFAAAELQELELRVQIANQFQVLAIGMQILAIISITMELLDTMGSL